MPRAQDAVQVAVLLITLAAVACSAGCRGASQSHAQPAPAPQVQLPDWAPKDPSPEFVRASRVLKPVPDQEFVKAFGDSPIAVAQAQRARMLWVPAYEFFGTLDDQQVQRFLKDWDPETKKKKVLIPVKSMTPKQRAAFDEYVRVWGKARLSQELPDYLVALYKNGAKKDLSNVRMGFVANGGHAVHVLNCVQGPHGEKNGFCSYFATI